MGCVKGRSIQKMTPTEVERAWYELFTGRSCYKPYGLGGYYLSNKCRVWFAPKPVECVNGIKKVYQEELL